MATVGFKGLNQLNPRVQSITVILSPLDQKINYILIQSMVVATKVVRTWRRHWSYTVQRVMKWQSYCCIQLIS